MTIIAAQIYNFTNLGGALDFVSAGIPPAAYGFRLLTGTYGGSNPCLTVRRSSDNATLTVGFVNGQLDTTTLTNFCGTSNGFLAEEC